MVIDSLQDRADVIKYKGNVNPTFYWVGDEPRLGLPEGSFKFSEESFDLFLETIHVPQSFLGRIRLADSALSEQIVNKSMPDKLHLLFNSDIVVGVFIKDRPFIPALAIHDTICEHLDVSFITLTDIDEQFYTAVYMVDHNYGVSVLYSDVFAGPPKFEAAVTKDNIIWRVPIANHKFRTIGDVLKIFDQLRYNIDEALFVAKSTTIPTESRNIREVGDTIVNQLKLPSSFRKNFVPDGYYNNSVLLERLRKANPYTTVAQRYNYDSILCRTILEQ